MSSLGSRPDNVLILGDCDTGVCKLAETLGWLNELETLWAETNPDCATREEQRQAYSAVSSISKAGYIQSISIFDFGLGGCPE